MACLSAALPHVSPLPLQGKWFVSQAAQQYDPSADGDLPGLVSIHSVHSAAEHSRLHAAFSRLEIAEIDERIGQLRRALEDNQRNLHTLSRAKAGQCRAGTMCC